MARWEYAMDITRMGVSKKHHSAAVVTGCMLLYQGKAPVTLCVGGSTPSPDCTGIAQWLEQQPNAGSSPAPVSTGVA